MRYFEKIAKAERHGGGSAGGAILSGILPGWGPAIHGAVTGHRGEKAEQALYEGGSSLLGALAGNLLVAPLLAKKKLLGTGPLLLPIAGSMLGARMGHKAFHKDKQ